jgi:sodium/proline symporter
VQKSLILIISFGILFALGYYASKRIKGIKDYYVDGEKLGYWGVAFSARATGESGR